MQPPIEVLEAIVDQASDNTVSLHHLSLTCITLLPRCRYHLFSDFVIRTVRQLEESPEFLDSCPWLAPLVQKVTLFVTIPRYNSKPNIRFLDVVPIHLLTRLPNLRTWTMETGDSELADISPSLSLHHSALRCYQKHGERIRSLELSVIIFYSISDFKGLVSAFTGLDSLTCYDIRFLSKEQHPVTAGTVATNARPPQVSTLKLCTSVDSRAVEYLLACGGSKLKHLTLQLRATDCRNGCPEHLEQSITGTPLARLCSLALIITPGNNSYMHIEERFCRIIRSATTILERINRGRLTDVGVEFKADPLAKLGARLSGASAPLEACKQLEAALLTFPNAPLLVRDPMRNRRAGRAKLWSPIIRRAFPRLTERGLLAFEFSPAKHDAPDLVGHENEVTRIVISHDSARAVTSSSDGTVIIWDMASGTVLQEWPNHQGARVAALALSADSQRLVSAGGHTLTVWGIGSSTARKVAVLDGHTDIVITCAWSPDDALIASASLDNTVRIWDGRTFEQRRLVPVNPSSQEAQCLQFSPDSRNLAWISGGTDCSIWRPLMGRQPKILRPHADGRDVVTTAFSFDHESRFLATAHGNQNYDPDTCVVRVWDAATGAALAVLAGHSKTVQNVAFSLDGRSLLSMDNDMSVRVWDRGTLWSGEQTGVCRGAESLASGRWQCVRPDWKLVAIGSDEGLVRLFRTGDGECVATFVEHGSMVYWVRFSPNGQFLVSGDTEGVVHIRCLSEFE